LHHLEFSRLNVFLVCRPDGCVDVPVDGRIAGTEDRPMAVQRFAVGVRVRPPIDRNNERFDVEAAAKADEFTVLLSNLGGRAFLGE